MTEKPAGRPVQNTLLGIAFISGIVAPFMLVAGLVSAWQAREILADGEPHTAVVLRKWQTTSMNRGNTIRHEHLAVSFNDRKGTPHEREVGDLLRPQSWKAAAPGETVDIHWHRADDEIALTADLHVHAQNEMTWFALGLGGVGILSGGGCWILARRRRRLQRP